ncbi:MAG: D-aminoacyl-tRNA deacylase [Dehalococcoidales bacterium]|nr:D-aminoacyl-tRNA deacylase [Dehalococcoidales bacterium]
MIQRVTHASVSVDAITIGRIGPGLVVLVGIANGDTGEDIDYLVQKTTGLRILDDTEGKLNLSVTDKKQELLLISQFTLLASTRKGKRPGFTDAAPPSTAEALFTRFVEQIKAAGLKVSTGRFQVNMQVELVNDGPVTIIIDSRERFSSRD